MNKQMNNSSHPGDEISEPPNIQADDVVLDTGTATPQGPGSQNTASPLLSPGAPPAEPTYYLAEEDEVGPGDSTEFAAPFQLSGPLPVVQGGQPTGASWGAYPPPVPPPTQPGKAAKKNPPLLRIAIIVLVSLVTLSILWVTVFAQPAQPLATRGTNTGATPTVRATARVQQTPTKTAPTPTPTTAAGPTTGSWVPQQLPAGWTAAGLTSGDALFAERTAWTFTDREEGLDYRNVGTRAAHGGTFTAAFFILSAGGRQRFQNNDVRVVDNTLFDHVKSVQLIQSAVNATPTLVQFQVQGNNQFAWVDISFELYQEQVSPNNAQQRVGGLEMGQGTNQPIIHHMSVLLVRVTPGTQGNNAPMGGTGWLVSSYGLDLPNGTPSLAIEQPI
jgi:hypothetical protein